MYGDKYDIYRRQMACRGDSIREANRNQSVNIMNAGFDTSQTYRRVLVDGEEVDARITLGSSTTIRGGSGNYEIMFRDGVDYPAGTYIWVPANTDTSKYEPWLMMYKSDDALFPRHIIKKCNYLLKWMNSSGNVIERWCVFGDNQRLMNSERDAYWNKLVLSSYTTVLYLPCDEETINIKMDRRFLVDHPDIEGNPEVWIVRNRNVNSKTYDSYDGIIELAIARHQYNHDVDNKELMVADYYKEYPQVEEFDDVDYDVRIAYKGTPELKMATPFKVYTAEFQADGVPDDTLVATWDVNVPDEYADKFIYETNGNELKIKCVYSSLLMGAYIRLTAFNEEHNISAELLVKVVSSI